MPDHAALLRRAAARVRETANAATEGPWAIWDDLNGHGFITVGDAQGVLTDERPFAEECNTVAHVFTQEDATHAALWHPGVALAVAGWLESWDGVDLDPSGPMPADYEHAVNVARALLGEDTE